MESNDQEAIRPRFVSEQVHYHAYFLRERWYATCCFLHRQFLPVESLQTLFFCTLGPHIGHLYSAVLADAVARYNAMLGHKTFLTTGTDEHGNKIRAAAAAAGLPNLEYCTKVSQQFRKMCDRFEVDYSRYIRTTEKQHCDAVHHFWVLRTLSLTISTIRSGLRLTYIGNCTFLETARGEGAYLSGEVFGMVLRVGRGVPVRRGAGGTKGPDR